MQETTQKPPQNPNQELMYQENVSDISFIENITLANNFLVINMSIDLRF